MSFNRLFILLPLFGVACSCATSRHAADEPLKIQSTTTIPESFGNSNALIDARTLLVPDRALALVKTVRNQVEVREGPGLAFQLKDEILPRNKTLIVVERSKKWVKVVEPVRNTTGWVHQQAIARIPPKGQHHAVATNVLPKAFAVAPIKRLYDYQDGIPIDVNIPKGSRFIRVREDNERSLVIIPQTTSLGWLNKKDIQ